MSMLLPVVDREMRTTARHPRTYWARTAAVLMGLVVCCFIYWIFSDAPPSMIGKSLFIGSSIIAFLFSISAGPAYTADCISEEKRQGTLGLLFLTDLRGYDVVLGKFASSSLLAVANLVACLPLLALGLLMGGVSPQDSASMMVVMLSTLFLSLATGMLASVCCVTSRAASTMTVLLMFCWLLVAPVALWIALEWVSSGGNFSTAAQDATIRWLGWQSPAYGLFASFPDSSIPRWVLWNSVGFSAGLGMVLLLISSLLLPRLWRGAMAGSPGKSEAKDSPPGRLKTHLGALERQDWLEVNPVTWLVRRLSSRRGILAGICGLALLCWLLVGLVLGADDGLIWALGYLVAQCFMKLWMCREASHRFIEDRRSGAFPLYANTLLSEREILRGGFRGLLGLFSVPVLLVIAIELLVVGLVVKDTDFWKEFLGIQWLGRMPMLVLDAMAIAHVGMWLGLRARGKNQVAGSFLRVLILPWVIVAAVLLLWAQLSRMQYLPGLEEWGVHVILFGIHGGLDLYWIFLVRRRMLREIRNWATAA